MSDEYLWDKSGKPDPEVERLEELLGELRSRRTGAFAEPARRRFAPILAVAALLVVAVGVSWLFLRSGDPGYMVTRLEGAPTAGSRAVDGTGSLGVGEWLETDGVSRAKLGIGEIGEVEVEPGTRLQHVASESAEHRLALDRGTIHALIWAPPRKFFVETPSALAVDLGCAYSLTVGDDGAGVLRVSMGWVGFEADGLESFIPAEAMCRTRPGVGPGTPHYEDASAAFREAVDRFDFGSVDGEARSAALDILLAEARPRDAFTLWHLLSRVDGAERERLYERMAALVPPPAGVTREGILQGEQEMLERWWDELGLGDTEWWRVWKLPEPPG